jgi:hypothetical protein
MDPALQNHPGWQWCTADGAELHTLLMGLKTTFREKLEWLEDAETLTLAMRSNRGKPSTPQPDTILSPPIDPAD